MTCILTVGQSDSCAGTGIQADVKTALCFGVYAATVVTAVTAQNTKAIFDLHVIPHEIVRQQINAVMDDLKPTVIKTGMLANADVIDMIGDYLDRDKQHGVKVVVDPVMTSRTGRRLLDKRAIDAIKRRLFIHADVLTPNITEGHDLTGYPIKDIDDARHVAGMLLTLGPRHVILKGGGLGGERVTDFLVTDQGLEQFDYPRADSRATHGAGTTLSTGIAASIARGMSVRDSYLCARQYLGRAIDQATMHGQGYNPVAHGYFFKPFQYHREDVA
jgi:hydroxymethylpyrimidine/phosphomethylpyrimidine kinase